MIAFVCQEAWGASKTRSILNTGGILIPGQYELVNAASLTNDGQLPSKGHMTLALASDFANTSGGVITANGNLTLSTSGNVSNSGKVQAGKTLNLTAIAAGNNVNISAGSATNSVDEAHQHASSGFMSNTIETTVDKLTQATAIGSSINAGGNLSVSAGNLKNIANKGGINLAGSILRSTAALSLAAADGDINIKTTLQTSASENSSSSTSRGLFSSSSNADTNKSVISSAQGSSISGGSVVMASGRDIAVQGSTIVADQDIGISTARDLSIISAQNLDASTFSSSSKRSGLMVSSMGFELGTVKSNETGTDNSVIQIGSQVASLGGNVRMKAGGRYAQTASEVEAFAPVTNGSTSSAESSTASNTAAAGEVSIVARTVKINGGR